MQQLKKGFTLIELLIVIGILAVLATITVLVLNPAELFRQARDSQRISDLSSLKNGISLYLTTITTPSLQGTAGFSCASNFGSDKSGSVTPFAGGSPAGVAAGYSLYASTLTTVDGTGWIPVNFGAIPGGAPLSVLPRDPNATDATQYYGYACNNTNLQFEINAKMESGRYKHTPVGADDVEGTDGGNQVNRLEVGNYPGLAL